MSTADGHYVERQVCHTVQEWVPVTPQEAQQLEEFSSGVPTYEQIVADLGVPRWDVNAPPSSPLPVILTPTPVDHPQAIDAPDVGIVVLLVMLAAAFLIRKTA